MASAGTGEEPPKVEICTVEKIVEVPMMQIVERIEYVSKEEYDRKRANNEPLEFVSLPGGEIRTETKFDKVLSQPADPEKELHHPRAAYLGEDQQQGLDFFRENGFIVIPDAVPQDRLEAARMAVERDGVRDNDSQEVLACLTEKVWNTVKMLVKKPVPPVKAQVARVQKVENYEADVEQSQRFYFPQDLHIDGLPSMATNDIMNFTCLVGVPLDPTPQIFMGNFGVFPGSHRRIQQSIRKDGMDQLRTKEWQPPLKRMSGADTHPMLPLQVVPGQAYIAHYQTVHFAMPNVRGSPSRRVLYFRVWNDRGSSEEALYMRADLACMTDIWMEYPLIPSDPYGPDDRRGDEPFAEAAPSADADFAEHDGYISGGGDIFAGIMTVAQAKAKCAELPGCRGFTFAGANTGEATQIFFKSKWDLNVSAQHRWTSFRYERCQLEAGEVPPPRPLTKEQEEELFEKHDGYISGGDDLLVARATLANAKAQCAALPGCKGFTFESTRAEDGLFIVAFKAKWDINKEPAGWTSYRYTRSS